MAARRLRSLVLRVVGCVALLAAMVILSPGIGTESASFTWWDVWRARFGRSIPESELKHRPSVDLDADGTISTVEAEGFAARARFVGFELRLSRSLLALQVGVTLALCGAVLQVLFRNPLAEPYTLGIAGGGSLGALLSIRIGWVTAFLGISSVTASAFVGALTVVAAAWVVSRGRRGPGVHELLLGGVAISLFCGAMMMLVTSLSNERVTFEAIRWMMGSLDPLVTVSGTVLTQLLVPIWVFLIACGRALNQYRLGDDLAASRGVNVRRLTAVCVLATTLATAVVVARCGPIGFVGLVVPRMATLLFGSDCRILFPTSALMGGAFLMACDWGSQLALRWAGWAAGRTMGSSTLPIGVITALVGVPVFLVLLQARSGNGRSTPPG